MSTLDMANELEHSITFPQMAAGNIVVRGMLVQGNNISTSSRAIGLVHNLEAAGLAVAAPSLGAPAFANTLYAPLSLQNLVQDKHVVQKQYSATLQAIAILAVALIVIGLVVGYLFPGIIVGLALPAGLTLWFLVGYFARREDTM
jgi:hypothetical protein